MDKLDKILGQALAKKGLGKATQGAMVCFYAQEWAKGRFRSISYQNGILKLAVDSSSASAELQIQEQKIIDDLNTRIGRKVVRQVRIIVSRER